MTPPSTQNLKTLSLWVLFLIKFVDLHLSFIIHKKNDFYDVFGLVKR